MHRETFLDFLGPFLGTPVSGAWGSLKQKYQKQSGWKWEETQHVPLVDYTLL